MGYRLCIIIPKSVAQVLRGVESVGKSKTTAYGFCAPTFDTKKPLKIDRTNTANDDVSTNLIVIFLIETVEGKGREGRGRCLLR